MQVRDLHPVILAGGLGTRLRRVLADVPKPMARVAGLPFLEWVIRYLQRQGCAHVTLSIGHRAEVFEAYFASGPIHGMQVDCVREPAPLGTAGGFLHAARSKQAPPGWLVMNGDSLLLDDLPLRVDTWQRHGTPAAVLARHVDDANRYGSLDVSDADRLLRFSEKAPNVRPGWINAGIYLLRHEMLERFPTNSPLSFEYDVFPNWLAQDTEISVMRSDAPFLDIGTEETLGQADSFVAQNARCFESK